MNKFTQWYTNYQSEITWWLIGWLSWGLLDAIGQGRWTLAAINAAFIFVNYKLWKK